MKKRVKTKIQIKISFKRYLVLIKKIQQTNEKKLNRQKKKRKEKERNFFKKR